MPPQKLEEVLVVVGGHVLEEGEDRDRGLEMSSTPRNFAFYNPKSSKCPRQGWGKHIHPPPPRMLINPPSTPKPPLAKRSGVRRGTGGRTGEGSVKQGWLKSIITVWGGSSLGSAGFQGNGWLCPTSLITTNGAFP